MDLVQSGQKAQKKDAQTQTQKASQKDSTSAEKTVRVGFFTFVSEYLLKQTAEKLFRALPRNSHQNRHFCVLENGVGKIPQKQAGQALPGR